MTCIDATEKAMRQIQDETGIAYDYVRNESPVDQLPSTYMVYFIVDDEVGNTFDNRADNHIPRIQVSLFSRDRRRIRDIPDKIVKAFQDGGFSVGGAGQIPYQPDTGHYGWYREFYYLDSFYN